jgi:hypothetical protein
MKSKFTVTCSCGQQSTVETTGTQDPKDLQCSACGTAFWFVRPLGNFVGTRILGRASAELQNKDFTLAIVLSAIAVECELARLFMKWNEVDLLDTRRATQADTDAWSEKWNKWTRIVVRLDKASALMVGDSYHIIPNC